MTRDILDTENYAPSIGLLRRAVGPDATLVTYLRAYSWALGVWTRSRGPFARSWLALVNDLRPYVDIHTHGCQ